MKTFLISMLLVLHIAAIGQIVSYTPMNAGFENTITIQFNLNFSTGEKVTKLMGKTEGLYLWGGAGTSEFNAFEYSPKEQINFNQPLEKGKLKNIGINRWEISLNPGVYFEVPEGKKIALLGLVVKNADGTAQTENIILKTGQSKDLSAVVVISKKPFIEQQVDKTVVNVQADINAIGSSAFEILQKAPGITITGEDVINMSGKAGVNVLIDGRPTQMGSKELSNFLRSLPGNGIEKIELITNPSSRFDAQGNAGIINIRLKKNRIKGTNGNVTAGYTFRDHYASNASFNINHRRGKLNAFTNAGIDNNLQHTTGNINRNVELNGTNKKFENQTVDIDRNTRYTVRTGLDFYANKKSTFGLLFNVNANRSPFYTPGRTLISSNDVVDSSLVTNNDNLYKNGRYNSNFNYKYEDTIGNELNIDGDYTYFKNTNLTNLNTIYLDKNNRTYGRSINDLDVGTRIHIYAVKADFYRKLKKLGGKLEAGIKASSVTTNNELFATSFNGTSMNTDTGRSNVFSYKEKIYAAYATFGQKIKKVEYQIGLRIENALLNGTSNDLRNKQINNPDTSYINLFPTAFVSYQLNDKNMLAVSFSRRINRPDYQSLNPFETIYDRYTSEKGNPYLRPQYTNNLELKYSYKYAMSVAIGYNHTQDYSQTISRQNGQTTTATNDNIGTLDNAYVNISSPLPINKWWDGYLSLTGFMNQYKGTLPDGKLDEKVVGMSYYVQQNFKLGNGWNMQLSSWYNSPTTEAIFKTSWLGSLDFSIRKYILQSKGSIRLAVNDIFNTQRWEQRVQFANQDYTYRRKWESRGVQLQFNWNFGSSKYSSREREANKDAGRIKEKH